MRRLLFISLLSLVGCAGSPVHTSSMNPNELRNVDDATLCTAFTPREMYSPSSTVILEVRRRGLNCRSFMPPEAPRAPQQTQQQIIIQQQPQMMNPSACIQDGGGTFCPNYRRR